MRIGDKYSKSTPSYRMDTSANSRKYWNALHISVATTILLIILHAGVSAADANGGGKTMGLKPAMGWNSYYSFGCGKQVREKNLRSQADVLADKGLVASGYNTLIIECGWEDYADDQGAPTVKKKAFQDGLSPFSAYLRTKGLQMGLGTWGGDQLCSRKGKRKRSLSLTQQTLARRKQEPHQYDWKKYISTLTGWGLTYLIHRPCGWANADRIQNADKAKELNTRYVQMADGISAAGANIFYATGQWGASPEAQNKRANSFRVSADAEDYWNSFIRIVNAYVPFASRTSPGAFSDLGFLQLGSDMKGLNTPEKISQFIFWAAAKSPLIISTDLYSLDQYSIDILKNPAALAVNQDELGKSITLTRRYSGDKDVWSGPLKDGGTVAVIINWAEGITSKQIDLADFGFASAHLYDLWNGKDLGKFNQTYSTSMGSHGALFLKLNETQPVAKRTFKRFPAETADLMGTAQLRDVNATTKAVSMIKPKGYAGVRWRNIPGGQTAGNVLFSFDFINAELSDGNGGKLNYKRTVVIVNDKDRVYVDFPISGQTWGDVYKGFLVSLPLEAGDSNKVLIQGLDDDWAPDFVALSVEQQQQSS